MQLQQTLFQGGRLPFAGMSGRRNKRICPSALAICMEYLVQLLGDADMQLGRECEFLLQGDTWGQLSCVSRGQDSSVPSPRLLLCCR